MQRVWTYDLTSKNGNGRGGDGPCADFSVTDDPGLPVNDPAPDLMDTTPDGKYMVVALRGPVPASVLHAATTKTPVPESVSACDTSSMLRNGRIVNVSARSSPTVVGSA